ncbi:hypothetical protein PL321_05285 [Caloramator sp. mosi_1]|uniref:hypothetical protein n=1 Tax=Caloramator sp. mosi_1 TaxID=3023090 RepID=UPI002362E4A1|nr:hypothetical protein [Caloramator sp. mosi_1]WDC84964.1 hypothetical protein PL321_05285 [Caloramator sp. mosi_1]
MYYKQIENEFNFNEIIFNNNNWNRIEENNEPNINGKIAVLILDKNNRVVAGFIYIKDNIEISTGF